MNIQEHKEDFEKIITFLSEQLGTIRSNRANPAMIENIQVDAYGTRNPLQQLASITSGDAQQLVVDPWDKSVIKDIEKSLSDANLGISIKNEGTLIRISFPPLTEESRKEIVKALNQKIEQSRISLRGLRDKLKEEIINSEREKEITEDDKYRTLEELDKITKEYKAKIDDMGKKKEEEIMTV